MCGIFGLIQSQPFLAQELARMSNAIRHRGPDDEGFALLNRDSTLLFGGADTPQSSYDPNVGYCPSHSLPNEGAIGRGGVMLGHRRLSILDLSSHGHQPMSFQNRYWITYNGEVYNYLELKLELQSYGYIFTTGTDTEVILAAYDRWGKDCLQRFNGMWAFAIFDTIEKSLFLARDRFGVKPLYLYEHGGRIAFASEIKAFSALTDWKARANRERLLDMLVWNVSDHTDETMFSGVRQVPAGSYVKACLRPLLDQHAEAHQLKLSPERWYSLPQRTNPASGEEAEKEFYDLLADSVRLRLRSDVAVGSCLSGGLDSSSIVCLMGRQLAEQESGARLHTFTARSHDAEFDESRYARAVVERAGTLSHEVTPEPLRLFNDLKQLTWHQDEPFGSTSIFAQWCVFNEARKAGAIVMLDGQGADEILCGYRGFLGAYLAGLVKRKRFAEWISEMRSIKREVGFSYTRSLGYTAAYSAPSLVSLLGRFDNRAYADRNWLAPSEREAYDRDPLHLLGARAASVQEMSRAQLTATNLPMLLHWEDRNSMAFSVEARVPFLDYRVVEFCLSLDDKEKLGGGLPKSVLRRSMRGTVPNLILDRRDKLGFVTAEKLWATRDMTERFRKELVGSVEKLRGILSPAIVDQFDEVAAGKRAFDHRYWRSISAAHWVSAFDVAL